MVPPWKKELDALVTETMAFAASVNEKKLGRPKQVDPGVADIRASTKDGGTQADSPALATVDAVALATVEAVLAQEPTLRGSSLAKLPPLTLPPSERDEIKQRLANFKAHQLRMQAERENFYGETMARTRALAAGSPLAKPTAE
jgi:hypothetical protein